MMILAAAQMDGAAEATFEEIFRDLYGPVTGFFANRGCSPEECHDLAQETFLRAYRGFSGFRGDAKPATWLFSIATHLWFSHLREAKAGKRDGTEVALPEDGQPGLMADAHLLDEAIDDERRRLLKAALEKLPPKMRRCVYLRVYQDMSFADIARILGITSETARSQVSLAKKKLRAVLVEDYPDLTTADDAPRRATR